MMKSRSTFLGFLLLCIVATLGYSVYHLRSINARLETRSSEAAKAYRMITERYALPLRGKNSLSAPQERSMKAIESSLKAVSSSSTAFIRVDNIRNLQLALRSLLAAIPADSDLARQSETLALRRAMESQAPIRAFIDPYNLVVKEWNNTVESRYWQIVALPAGVHLTAIPLLRFDGVKEYKTTISL